jgi:hypothetical protein
MTSKSQHKPDASDRPLNQNNQMSEDAGDGSRRSAQLGRTGGKTAAEAPPDEDAQDQSAIEAFGEEGAGIAAKE